MTPHVNDVIAEPLELLWFFDNGQRAARGVLMSSAASAAITSVQIIIVLQRNFERTAFVEDVTDIVFLGGGGKPPKRFPAHGSRRPKAPVDLC